MVSRVLSVVGCKSDLTHQHRHSTTPLWGAVLCILIVNKCCWMITACAVTSHVWTLLGKYLHFGGESDIILWPHERQPNRKRHTSFGWGVWFLRPQPLDRTEAERVIIDFYYYFTLKSECFNIAWNANCEASIGNVYLKSIISVVIINCTTTETK